MSVPLRWHETVQKETPDPAMQRQPKRNRARQRALINLGVVILLLSSVLVLAGIGALAVWERSTMPPALKMAMPAQSNTVALGSVSAERGFGFVTVTGSAMSHAVKPLRNVEAVIELLDSHQRTVQMERGMLAFDTLAAGASSPFRLEVKDDPRAVQYRVQFRLLSGDPLN